MAILTATDVGEIRDSIYQVGLGKEELKALPAIPSQSQQTTAFQSLEDRLVTLFSTLKSDIEAAFSFTITSTLAQKIVAGYLRWKIKKLLGI